MSMFGSQVFFVILIFSCFPTPSSHGLFGNNAKASESGSFMSRLSSSPLPYAIRNSFPAGPPSSNEKPEIKLVSTS